MIGENKTIDLDRKVEEKTKTKTITNQITSNNISIDSDSEKCMIDEEDTTNLYRSIE